jgi:hypothetical protein
MKKPSMRSVAVESGRSSPKSLVESNVITPVIK